MASSFRANNDRCRPVTIAPKRPCHFNIFFKNFNAADLLRVFVTSFRAPRPPIDGTWRCDLITCNAPPNWATRIRYRSGQNADDPKICTTDGQRSAVSHRRAVSAWGRSVDHFLRRRLPPRDPVSNGSAGLLLPRHHLNTRCCRHAVCAFERSYSSGDGRLKVCGAFG